MTPEERASTLVTKWQDALRGDAVLPELITAAIRAAVMVEREECCRAICPWCAKDAPRSLGCLHGWPLLVLCRAAAIRERREP